jgi:hypothetical protein
MLNKGILSSVKTFGRLFRVIFRRFPAFDRNILRKGRKFAMLM